MSTRNIKKLKSKINLAVDGIDYCAQIANKTEAILK